MENPLIMVHRSLRPHPVRRHTSTTPAPKSPQRHTPQPPTLPQDTMEAKDGLPSLSWCPSRKRKAGETHPGTPEGKNSEKIHASTLNTAPETCEYTRKYKSQKKRFFKVFLKIRTDDAFLTSVGMLFQIFAPLKQMERKPYCRVFFAR